MNDQIEINDWLNLDQADEDIGIFNNNELTNNNYYFNFNPNNEDLLLLNQQEESSTTTTTTATIDPSTIISHYPSSSNNNNQFPSYALDPALLTATTNTNNQQSNGDLKITLPLRLPSSFKREEEEEEEEEEEDDIQEQRRNTHSRSSSAITLGQQSSTQPTTHKRTLSHSHALINVPEWEDKPSLEEYKNLTSKEKRQLRNKISARNFRHRRKQHISDLELQVAQRDLTIDNLVQDLCNLKNENKDLKNQVDLLKLKWSDLMKKIEEISISSFPTTSSTTAANSSSTPVPSSSSNNTNPNLPGSPRLRSTKSNGLIPLPNLHKDLGSHTRKPFNGVGGMAGHGNVGVHTTLIPDVSVDVYEGAPIRSPSSYPVESLIIKIEEKEEEILSPQALLELKFENQVDDDKKIKARIGSPFSNKENRSSDDHHQQPDVVSNGSDQEDDDKVKEIERKLWRLVHEVLRPEDDDDEEECAIDPIKLKSVLDGTLVLKLVDPINPPPPYHNLLDQYQVPIRT
ncbi:hypothetical protein MJO28_008475 [Puccinia striiformis f. sp. tritici]|uniref:Uncharacterized protein n=1 Tax=Puccinia striiformis f. sp. tritici TaxID=168172 RepID=A0ACC0EB93_9BASI|nr:hypothetical protein MJO28_008475 [Puccinia striiformis f. sp. tritici]